ncbi:hypothetical protein [Lactococcus lactis]|uniref:hypothetical protein n=1 Tax=Lactococcus lactis TaxID=1358 RepID=UPI0035BBE393
MNGFKINNLIAMGKDVPTVNVEFKDGLNLIIGPSNTGKTYIFEAIDYMLGGGSVPKEISQDKNYLIMYLEIELLKSKETFTISRSLKNPKDMITLFYSKFSEIESAQSEQLYYEANKSEKNISTFLLKLCGFELPIKIRKTTNYDKTNFTFRSYIPYSMVAEPKMISENSPIYDNDSFNDKTKYLYHFKYLITNEDDSNVERVISKNIFDETKKSNITLLKELLGQEKEKYHNLSGKIEYNTQDFDADITTTFLKNIQQEIQIINQKILEFDTSKNKIVSDIAYNNSVLRRFKLLKNQYESDIERLQFIDEGSFLINQLVIHKCPNCGAEIDASHSCNDIDLSTINDSCQFEIQQYNLKLKELDISINTTINLVNTLKEELSFVNEEIKINKEKLADNLNPELKTLKTKLEQLSNFEMIKTEVSQVEDKIAEYNTMIQAYKEKKFLNYGSPMQLALKRIKDTSFTDFLEDVLENFYYNQGEKAKVSFNTNGKEIDFSINDEKRGTVGKGTRALLTSSFFMAVRNYCISKGLPHANFLILDSPINAFKQQEYLEHLDSSIKNKFLNYLSINVGQTIIMENLYVSDIPADLKEKINIIEFTKTDEGRYGFY